MATNLSSQIVVNGGLPKTSDEIAVLFCAAFVQGLTEFMIVLGFAKGAEALAPKADAMDDVVKTVILPILSGGKQDVGV